MRKLTILLVATCIPLFATANATAAVTTTKNGFATTIVYCHPYTGYVGTNTEVTDEEGSLTQPVRWNTGLEFWNGSAWVLYRQHLVQLEDGGSAYYAYAFHVPHGHYYRVHATYGWAQAYPTPTLYGSEVVGMYSQYGSTFNTRNSHYARSHYCYA